MPLRIRRLASTLFVVLIAPQVAFAGGEGSTGNVSATYTVLHDTESAFTYDRGLSFGATYRVHGWLHVAGEASFSSHHEDYASSQGGTYDFRYQSFQAGPRASPLTGRIQPYAEVLAGVTRLGVWETRLDNTGQWGSPDFSVQPGIGVDLFVARRVALRIGGDLRVLFRHDNRFDRAYRTELYQFNVGLAFHFGGS